MLDEIRRDNPVLYAEIEHATGGQADFVVDDAIFAWTETPDSSGRLLPRDYLYEEIQVWKQKAGLVAPRGA